MEIAECAAAMDEFPKPFAPMLADEVKRPFHKPGWIYEEKYDGYRMLVFKEGERVQLISRNRKDFTRQFAEIVQGLAALKAKTLILDGEVAVFDERLVSHLGYLRGAPADQIFTPPMYVAFDCLYARGKNLMAQPLRRRRSVLEREVRGAPGPIILARRLADDGLEAWKEVVSHGWEGLMAKDSASLYEPGARTRSWVKVKHKVRIGWPGEGTEYTRG
jgi:bifunctional non-homologous end joining protein LigD